MSFPQDGGCTCPGDVAKAFGAGADYVMLGGMFAGHDQSGGEIIDRDGKKYKLFYGMSSNTAMNKYHGGVADYRYHLHFCGGGGIHIRRLKHVWTWLHTS